MSGNLKNRFCNMKQVQIMMIYGYVHEYKLYKTYDAQNNLQ